jgi:tRNA modification GTPase
MALVGRAEPLPARVATFAAIRDPDVPAGHAPRTIDQVIVTRFEAPRSYTTEDVVEISAHGSPVLLRRIVELAIAGGARLAEPGEFTLRAYLHGRIDLVQAEAVADLIDAVTPLQARAAMDQLEGTLTGTIGTIHRTLFDLIAKLEASLDFPEEGFHFVTRDETAAALARVRVMIETLVREGRAGRLLREGSLVVVAGRPNAGKSTLFNALVGTDRAIVTPVPGTTRDLLTETVDLGGIPATIVDTAGLRDAVDVIEAEGVRRARQAQELAAMTLLVVDGSAPLDPEDARLVEQLRAPGLVVMSKSDLPPAWSEDAWPALDGRAIRVSAHEGHGLAELRSRIVRELTERDDWRDPPAISNTRQIGHAREALAALEVAEAALAAGATEEVVVAELTAAREALEAIVGRTTPDDVLRHIFERFCIGK